MNIFNLVIILVTLLFAACQKEHSNYNKNFSYSEFSLIHGGEKSSIEEFPFMVNIWLNTPQDHYVDHLCGGSLIDPKWVLTAAHCVLEDITDKSLGLLKLNNLNLYIGSSKISGEGGQKLQAKKILVHPAFSWPYHDIALIELTEEVTQVKTILLNQNDTNLPVLATVAGWGVIDEKGSQSPEFLQKINLNLITREECALDQFVQKKNWNIGSDTICVKTNKNKTASCHGDSGGPLFQKIKDQYVQIGVVSWGSGCRGAYSNQLSNVEGYSSVADAYSWIKSAIEHQN